MPPALSDGEDNSASGGEEVEIPSRPKAQGKGKGKAPAAPVKEPEPVVDDVDEEEDDESVAEDEYVVEKVVGHKIGKDGDVLYHVKWQGYEKLSDRTWEPESNLDGAVDILNEYFEEIGGRPEKGKKRKGRKSGAEPEDGTPASSAKRAKKEQEWAPPNGSWENDVDYVDTVEESLDPKTGKNARFAYLVWNNQKKTQHPLVHVYHKCPQKMLLYYESHLVFTPPGQDDLPNGDDKEMIMADD